MKRVLVIDDDPKLRYIIELNLLAAGHEVFLAEDGPTGLELAKSKMPDLVILDVMMPGMSGFNVCKTVREEPGFPDCSILILTARGEIADKEEGFLAGADDYLVKPFDPRELVWRSESLLRRLRRPNPLDESKTVGALELVPGRQEVRTPQRVIQLTQVEFALLWVLAESPDLAVAPELIHQRVWGSGDVDIPTLRVHVNRIRQRLEPVPEVPRYLKTVRGRGYMLATSG